MDPAHASRAATALEIKGLITRYADPEDNRRKLLRMTPDGRALFDRLWPQARGLVGAITEPLSPDDLAAFKALLDRVNEIAAPLLAAGNSGDDARTAA